MNLVLDFELQIIIRCKIYSSFEICIEFFREIQIQWRKSYENKQSNFFCFRSKYIHVFRISEFNLPINFIWL